MKFTIYQGSLQGNRPYNQDRLAYSYSKEALLMVVADGMGGYRHGEIAAQLAVKMLTEAFQGSALPSLSSPSRFLNEQIMQVHEAIDEVREAHGWLESPRTTVAAAIVQGDYLYTAHVGDSRIYHFRGHDLLFRTEDHSVIQMLIRKGQITPDQIETHPDRNKIYNCLGSDHIPQIDIAHKRELWQGDIVVLCSDGFWSATTQELIRETLFSQSVNVSGARLLQATEASGRGNGDNLSLIAMQWGEHIDSRVAISTGTMPLGETTTIMNNTLQRTVMMTDNQAEPDLTDEEIEIAIANIRAAIQKGKPRNF